MNTHSPLPWKAKQLNSSINCIWSEGVSIASVSGKITDPLTDYANAQFIVTACNSHHALVEALNASLNICARLLAAGRTPTLEETSSINAELGSIRAALILAKGEQK